MLRGDEVAYTNDLSPYGLPHVVEEKPISYVSYQDFANGFKPKKNVVVGATVVASAASGKYAIVTKIQSRGRYKHLFCWLKVDNKTQVVKKQNVIAVPAIGEFVRQLSTGIWFQVYELAALIGMKKVLISPKKKTKKTRKGVYYVHFYNFACYFYCYFYF